MNSFALPRLVGVFFYIHSMKSDAKLLSILVWLITAYAALWFGTFTASSAIGWIFAGIIFALAFIVERKAMDNRPNGIVVIAWIAYLFTLVASIFILDEIFSIAYGVLLVLQFSFQKDKLKSIWSNR